MSSNFRYDHKMNNDFAVPSGIGENLIAALTASEQAQLVRRVADLVSDPLDLTYIFKHALVQDSAYTSLTRHERKRLHRRVGEVLEYIYSAQLDDIAALLGYHFERAEEWDKALGYLVRAAEGVRRAGAHHEEADLLARAIVIASSRESAERIVELRIQRAGALSQVTRWGEAREELDRALELAPPATPERRARVLLELAEVTEWLWDTAQSAEYAKEALELAERLGRTDLQANALLMLAFVQISDGHPRQGIEYYDRVFSQRSEFDTPLVRAMEFAGSALYWLGDLPRAIERNRQALQRGRELQDSVTIMRALPNLAASLAGRGDYREAFRVFGEARAFGQEHEIGAWLARSISMESGVHLALFDYAGAEELALEAREVARRARFAPAGVSAAIDLMLNYTQRGEIARAQSFSQEVERAIPATRGSHRWLWETRYMYAQAELALALGQLDAAKDAADEALARSRATGRIKYQALALLTRGAAERLAGDSPAALADVRAAYELAQQLDDPAIRLRAIVNWLALDSDDAQLAETRRLAQRISHGLPDGSLRERFEAIAFEWM